MAFEQAIRNVIGGGAGRAAAPVRVCAIELGI
jgi:hypothetical protein